jgi:hypothetical protein
MPLVHKNSTGQPWVETGMQMRNYRAHEPWRREDVERKVRGGFGAGVAKERR